MVLPPPIIAPSILSADFAALGTEIQAVDRAGADWIHIDVMDGRFVPNITIGPLVCQALRPLSSKYLDCHLMIVEPERYVDAFAKAGADGITVHAEACPHLHRNLQQIQSLQHHRGQDHKVQVGVSLNPHSPLECILNILELCDVVLLMTVNPGFGGQKFIEQVLPKIVTLRQEIDRRKLATRIQVDGGINTENIERIAQMGADCFVAGSAVFCHPTFGKDYPAAIASLRDGAMRGQNS